MYWHDIYDLLNSIEHEFKFAGKYGAKGEKRQKKKKPTREQIEKQNQANRETRLRRTIKLNFQKYDIWSCCKYPEGTRLEVEEVKADVKEFLGKLRKAYKKKNAVLKYIYRLEIGKYGGIHFHLLVNRIVGADTDIILTDCWQQVLKRRGIPPGKTGGMIDFRTLYEAGGYKNLAEYIVKKPKKDSKEYKQLSLFPEEDRKKLLAISTSRNLVRPEPERKVFSHWTMRKILENGPKPTPGYYIDKDSVYVGINPYTGYSYLKYTEFRLSDRGDPGGEFYESS